MIETNGYTKKEIYIEVTTAVDFLMGKRKYIERQVYENNNSDYFVKCSSCGAMTDYHTGTHCVSCGRSIEENKRIIEKNDCR